jgi:hypothetical protein
VSAPLTDWLHELAALRRAATAGPLGWQSNYAYGSGPRRAYNLAIGSITADDFEALAGLWEAARSTLDAMAMDPCDCMAHRSPPEMLGSALEALARRAER